MEQFLLQNLDGVLDQLWYRESYKESEKLKR